MKYKNFHIDKPQVHQLIYWLNPQIREVLGFFMGGSVFIEADGTQRGYYAKYWRPASEEDALLATWKPDGSHIPPVVPKRAYNKKSVNKEKKSKTEKKKR
jgi:hypothetical protein